MRNDSVTRNISDQLKLLSPENGSGTRDFEMEGKIRSLLLGTEPVPEVTATVEVTPGAQPAEGVQNIDLIGPIGGLIAVLLVALLIVAFKCAPKWWWEPRRTAASDSRRSAAPSGNTVTTWRRCTGEEPDTDAKADWAIMLDAKVSDGFVRSMIFLIKQQARYFIVEGEKRHYGDGFDYPYTTWGGEIKPDLVRSVDFEYSQIIRSIFKAEEEGTLDRFHPIYDTYLYPFDFGLLEYLNLPKALVQRLETLNAVAMTREQNKIQISDDDALKPGKPESGVKTDWAILLDASGSTRYVLSLTYLVAQGARRFIVRGSDIMDEREGHPPIEEWAKLDLSRVWIARFVCADRVREILKAEQEGAPIPYPRLSDCYYPFGSVEQTGFPEPLMEQIRRIFKEKEPWAILLSPQADWQNRVFLNKKDGKYFLVRGRCTYGDIRTGAPDGYSKEWTELTPAQLQGTFPYDAKVREIIAAERAGELERYHPTAYMDFENP